MVLDYLLKPVNSAEFIAAVKRAKVNIQKPAPNQTHKQEQPALIDFLTVNQKDKADILKYAEIIHLEAQRSYTQIHRTENRKIISSKPLKEYDEILPQNIFLRVHKAHIINVNHVVKIFKTGFGSILLTNNTTVPISFTRRKEVKKRLNY